MPDPPELESQVTVSWEPSSGPPQEQEVALTADLFFGPQRDHLLQLLT